VEVLTLTVDASGRLDAWLAKNTDQTRSRLKALILAGNVTVDGVVLLRPAHRLRGGERIRLVVPAPPPATPQPQDIPLQILHIDEHVVVVVKPPGMVVHPSRGHPDGTLVNALLHLITEKTGDDPTRPGIVHRLDRGTSGVLVVARTPRAHAHLAAQFAQRSVERRYLALAWGSADPGGTIDAPLGRHPRDRLRFAVVEGGKRAVTHWRRLGRADLGAHSISLITCRLETGRTHQIRVHMRHAGYPLLGDPLYGARRKRVPDGVSAPTDPLLHAWTLGFEHPALAQTLRFSVGLEGLRGDFQAVLAAAGLADPTRRDHR